MTQHDNDQDSDRLPQLMLHFRLCSQGGSLGPLKISTYLSTLIENQIILYMTNKYILLANISKRTRDYMRYEAGKH